MDKPIAPITTGGSAPPPFWTAEPQRLVPYSREWHIAKIVIRSIGSLLAIISIGLAGATASTYLSYSHTTGIGWLWSLPIALACFVWDMAEFLTLFLRRAKQRGIHPGAQVGVELCLWLGCVALGVLTFLAPPSSIRTGQGYYYSWIDTTTSEYRTNLALGTVTVILSVPHFILFARACRETEQRNKVKSPERLVYVPGGGKPFIISTTPVVLAGDHNSPAQIHPHMDYDHDFSQDSHYEVDLNLPPPKEVIPAYLK